MHLVFLLIDWGLGKVIRKSFCDNILSENIGFYLHRLPKHLAWKRKHLTFSKRHHCALKWNILPMLKLPSDDKKFAFCSLWSGAKHSTCIPHQKVCKVGSKDATRVFDEHCCHFLLMPLVSWWQTVQQETRGERQRHETKVPCWTWTRDFVGIWHAL